MKVYHLSHIDLDGYSAQYLTNQIFKDITFRNSNYGDEIMVHLNIFCDEIGMLSNDVEVLMLITDLNLTLDESLKLDKRVSELKKSGKNIKLELIDHHKTGADSSDAFDWYYLDTNKCATLLTYDYLLKNGYILNDDITEYVKIVNSIDIWLDKDVNRFKYGKVCMKYISESRELNRYMFSSLDVNYKFFLIGKMIKAMSKENREVYLDDNFHYYKKEFFSKGDINYTLDDLYVSSIVEALKNDRENLSIYYKGYKGILTFCLGNSSIIGNALLKEYGDEFDFYLDCSLKGSFSVRADFKCDVSILARELGNGGGHANASGGRIDHFKENYDYKQVREFIQKLFDKM